MKAGAPLDARLSAALRLIRAETHADIGTDHAKLPVALICERRCQRVIGVELNAGPLAVARAEVNRAKLQGQIALRLGDGFEALHAGEVQSASLTGLGGRTIRAVLTRAAWLPTALVAQANAEAGAVRCWALGAGYHLTHEELAAGFWRYPVLRLERRPGRDPVYQGLPLEAAIKFGPHLLRRADPQLLAELRVQAQRLERLAVHGAPAVTADLALVHVALAALGMPDAAGQPREG